MPVPKDSLIIWTGNPVGKGVSDSCWVSIGANEKAAIGKRNNPAKGNGWVLYNELICYRIAVELDLPIASSFVHKPRGEDPFFWQVNFNGAGDMPPAIDPPAFVKAQPQVAAQIVAFDVLVINTDRHAGNLAYLKRPDSEERVFIFDHSHTLFGGHLHQPGSARLKKGPDWLGCNGPIGNRHCLLEHLTDAVALDQELERIRTTLTDRTIASAVSEAHQWGLGKADCNAARSALKKRRDSLKTLVARNHASFPGIVQWNLAAEE